MSSWEYRVYKDHDPFGGDYYYIGEFYYNPTGTSEPVLPQGETVDELKDDMALMMRAFDKPVIDFKTGEELPNG